MTDDGTPPPGDQGPNPEPATDASPPPPPPPRGRGRPKLVVNNVWPGLEYQNGGGPKPNLANTKAALRKLGCRCSYNLFTHQFEVNGPRELKLSATSTAVNLDIGEIDDNAVTQLRNYILDTYRFDPGDRHVQDAIAALGLEHQFHPVCDYLDGLKWDDIPRVDLWLTTVYDAEDNVYTRAVGRLWLIAAVRRVRHPGCKFDTALMFEGRQGIAKSKSLNILAVKDEWFSDIDVLGLPMKEQIELTEGIWINELGEMGSVRRGKENEKIKAYLSRKRDRSRMAYGRLTAKRPRQCVLAGTINHDQYLKDETGNRRYWPIAAKGEANLEWLREWRDQLWAEASAIEKTLLMTDEALELPRELWPVAAIEQEKRMTEDPWLETLSALVPEKGKSARYLSDHLAKEILNVNMHNGSVYDGWKRLKHIMTEKLGFEYSKTLRTERGRGKGYFFRSDTEQDPDDPPSASQAAANEAAQARKAAEAAAAAGDVEAAEQAARDAKAAADMAASIAKYAAQRTAGGTEAKATENADDVPF
jgi:predicted P-loop ATPase